jgi:hypothetical protein
MESWCETCQTSGKDGRIHGLSYSVSRKTFFSVLEGKHIPISEESLAKLACFYNVDIVMGWGPDQNPPKGGGRE